MKFPAGTAVAFFSVLVRDRLMAFLPVRANAKMYKPISDSTGTRTSSRIFWRMDRRRNPMAQASAGRTESDRSATKELRTAPPEQRSVAVTQITDRQNALITGVLYVFCNVYREISELLGVGPARRALGPGAATRWLPPS